MASVYLTNLIKRRDAIAAELAALDDCKVGGKPNTKSQEGGTTIDHVGYRKSLVDELKEINQLIIDADLVDSAASDDDGPAEFITQGTV